MPSRARGWLLLLATAAITAGALMLLFPRKSGPDNGLSGRHSAGPPPETNQQ